MLRTNIFTCPTQNDLMSTNKFLHFHNEAIPLYHDKQSAVGGSQNGSSVTAKALFIFVLFSKIWKPS